MAAGITEGDDDKDDTERSEGKPSVVVADVARKYADAEADEGEKRYDDANDTEQMTEMVVFDVTLVSMVQTMDGAGDELFEIFSGADVGRVDDAGFDMLNTGGDGGEVFGDGFDIYGDFFAVAFFQGVHEQSSFVRCKICLYYSTSGLKSQWLEGGFAGFDELEKERVWGERTRFELGMGLGSNEERMILGFDKFDKFTVWRGAGNEKTALCDFWEEGLVDFVAVAVTFGDLGSAVNLCGLGALDENCGIATEAHGAAGGFFAFLLRHKIDDVVPCFLCGAKFFGVGGFDAA